MRPKFPQTVTIRTPPEVVVDPLSGNERPLPATPVTSPAWLAQKPVGQTGAQEELLATQDTLVSLWTLLVPAGTTLTSKSTVTDSQSRRFQVVGEVADRPNHKPQFRAAALRLISDLQ